MKNITSTANETKSNNNRNKVSFSFQNEEIFEDDFIEGQSFTTKFQCFIFMLIKFLLLFFSKIATDKAEKEILISNIDELIGKLELKKNDLNSKKIQQDQLFEERQKSELFSQFSDVKESLIKNSQIMKDIFQETNLNISNINCINDLYDKIQDSIDKINSSIIQELIKYVNSFSIKIHQINNFIKALKVTENKILTFLQKFTKLLEKSEKSSENFTVIDSLFVDQKFDPIIIFSIQPPETAKKFEQKEKIIKNFDLLNVQEFKTQIDQIIIKPQTDNQNQDNKYNDIVFYLQTNVTKFTTKLIKIIEKSNNYSELYQKLEKFQTKNQFPFDTQLFEYTFDRYFSEFYFFVLYFISKYHYKQSGEIIMNNLNLLNKLYNKYIGESLIIDAFNELVEELMKSETMKSYNFTKLHKQDEMINLLNKLQNDGKYFYIKKLFQILINLLIDSNLFTPILKESLKDYGDNGDKMQVVTEILRMNEINSSYKIYYDQEMNFYLQKTYNNSIKQKKTKREKEILLANPSKFVVHIGEDKIEQNCNKIYIPYFPIGTLENIIQSLPQKPKSKPQHQPQQQPPLPPQLKIERLKVELTNVDRVVILLEIATALSDLHSNDQYHGNLCDQFIFISSQLDAYIGSFCYCKNLEGDATKPRGPFYFRAPENFVNQLITQQNAQQQKQHEEEEDESNVNFEDQKLNDIFSFGVILHEVLTDTNPESRMGNRSREERLNLLKGNYCEFLFSGEKNEIFDENSTDSFGNNLSDFKEIIEKCLKIDKNERYNNMKEVIDDINKTSFYKQNKEEIEYRMSNSVESKSYQCKISDIYSSYIQGVSSCCDEILKFLTIYDQFSSKNKLQKFDIIDSLFDTFDIKFEKDYTFHFVDIFNPLITKVVVSSFKNNITIDSNDGMFSYSLDANRNLKGKFDIYDKMKSNDNEKHYDFIIPVSSLDCFMENNKNNAQIENHSLSWICFIAKELAHIHSINLYHGELSMETIGVYFDNSNRLFSPSPILFYSFYKQKGMNLNPKALKKKAKIMNKNNQSKDEKIEGLQQKDIYDFKKLLMQFKHPKMSTSFLNEIDGMESMNLILNSLYSLINENDYKKVLERPFSKEDYLSYQITYPVLKNLYTKMISDYNLKNSIIEIMPVLSIITVFLNNTLSNLEKPIKDNIPDFNDQEIKATAEKNDDELAIKKQFSIINNKCCSLFFKILESEQDCPICNGIEFKEVNKNLIYTSDKETIETPKLIGSKILKERFETVSRVHDKLRAKNAKLSIIGKKEVFRFVEFGGLFKKSFNFLFERYIKNLNPNLRFRITVKLTNVKYLDTQDESIKLSHIKKIISEIGPEWKEPEPVDGNIVVYVNIPKLEKLQTEK